MEELHGNHFLKLFMGISNETTTRGFTVQTTDRPPTLLLTWTDVRRRYHGGSTLNHTQHSSCAISRTQNGQQSPAHSVSIIPMSYAGGQEITSSRLSSDIVCRVWIGPSATNRRPSTSSPRKAKGKHTATGTSVSKGYVWTRELHRVQPP